MISHHIKHIFFWLSGAGAESLESCPNWEQRKYVAYGATVLVPSPRGERFSDGGRYLRYYVPLESLRKCSSGL